METTKFLMDFVFAWLNESWMWPYDWAIAGIISSAIAIWMILRSPTGERNGPMLFLLAMILIVLGKVSLWSVMAIGFVMVCDKINKRFSNTP